MHDAVQVEVVDDSRIVFRLEYELLPLAQQPCWQGTRKPSGTVAVLLPLVVKVELADLYQGL